VKEQIMQQTFPANKEPRVQIDSIDGDFHVTSWDAGTISITTDGHISELYQEGDAVVIRGCEDDLLLQVPVDSVIRASNVNGDVSIQQVRRVELHDIDGDVVVEHIGQGVDMEAVTVSNVSGDLVVRDATTLRVREVVNGDAAISNVALVEIERIDGDVSLQHAETAVIGTIGGDFSASGIEDTLSCGNAGGDCSISGGGRGACTIGNVGSDLSIVGLTTVHVGSVGGDCTLRDAPGGIEVGNIGGDASFHTIGERIQVGNIGSDASMKALQGAIDAGNIGGDLVLEAVFPAGSVTRLRVGGDAVVRLPTPSDLALHAFVGGDVSGVSTASGGGNQVNLVYGGGAAQLDLYVGGDLSLRGGGQPNSSSSHGGKGSWGNWQSEFEGEMAELGREMGKLGQEISREIADAFKDAGWQKGSEWANAFTGKMEEQIRRAQRKAEEQARKAEERTRKAHEQAARVRVRFNDREWQLDPERLERLKEQATRAANEGIAGALDAVERAIKNLRVPPPPRPPTPPGAPRPPAPPQPPVPPTPGQAPSMTRSAPQPSQQPQQPTDGQGKASSQPSDTKDDSDEPNLEQEREAILRMIAEGRISPEEGDMLLEGLGG
jgi:SHOCT-like domain